MLTIQRTTPPPVKLPITETKNIVNVEAPVYASPQDEIVDSEKSTTLEKWIPRVTGLAGSTAAAVGLTKAAPALLAAGASVVAPLALGAVAGGILGAAPVLIHAAMGENQIGEAYVPATISGLATAAMGAGIAVAATCTTAGVGAAGLAVGGIVGAGLVAFSTAKRAVKFISRKLNSDRSGSPSSSSRNVEKKAKEVGKLPTGDDNQRISLKKPSPFQLNRSRSN